MVDLRQAAHATVLPVVLEAGREARDGEGLALLRALAEAERVLRVEHVPEVLLNIVCDFETALEGEEEGEVVDGRGED